MDGEFLAVSRKFTGYKQTITLSFCSGRTCLLGRQVRLYIFIGGLTYGLKKIYKIERTQAVLSVPLIGALFLMQREDKNGN